MTDILKIKSSFAFNGVVYYASFSVNKSIFRKDSVQIDICTKKKGLFGLRTLSKVSKPILVSIQDFKAFSASEALNVVRELKKRSISQLQLAQN